MIQPNPASKRAWRNARAAAMTASSSSRVRSSNIATLSEPSPHTNLRSASFGRDGGVEERRGRGGELVDRRGRSPSQSLRCERRGASGRTPGPTCTVGRQWASSSPSPNDRRRPRGQRALRAQPLADRDGSRALFVAGRGDRRPAADVLARRLFETGQVDAVHVYSNIVTVELARGGRPEPADRRRPHAVPLLAAGDAAAGVRGPRGPRRAAGGRGAGRRRGDGGDAAPSAAAQRVPAHLLERARAGRERWKAKAGG